MYRHQEGWTLYLYQLLIYMFENLQLSFKINIKMINLNKFEIDSKNFLSCSLYSS